MKTKLWLDLLLYHIKKDLTDSERIELIDQKHHLEKIYKQKAEGCFHQISLELVRGRLAELFLQAGNAVKNYIQQLCIDGNVTHDFKVIADFCARFYNDLYSSKFCQDSATKCFDSLSHIKKKSVMKIVVDVMHLLVFQKLLSLLII